MWFIFMVFLLVLIVVNINLFILTEIEELKNKIMDKRNSKSKRIMYSICLFGLIVGLGLAFFGYMLFVQELVNTI